MKPFQFFLAICLGVASQCAEAAPYHLVHAFTGGDKDGRTPTLQSSLTASGSILYGMTLDGGKYTNGVVFQFDTQTKVESLIHTFSGWSVLNMKGSKTDGAYPVGTPVLLGSKLYGVTGQGGSNGPSYAYGMGTVFSVNTDGSDFQILHNFGLFGDGSTPVGSLVLFGSTLYGMTEAGGGNNALQGTIFSIETDGSGYQILYNFDNNGGSPQGSLAVAPTSRKLSTLYGMTPGAIFEIGTDGSNFLVVHNFAGSQNDGAMAMGSVTVSLPYLYGMTLQGGENDVGCVFKLDLIGSGMQILHSFSLFEAAQPWGDLALSGSTLYGMTYYGVTNYEHLASIGSGAVFQINTDGSDYQVMHTFEFPVVSNDGSLPFGTPVVVGSELYGMTSIGGGPADGGCIFSLTLSPGPGSGGGTAPTITTASPLLNGKVGVAYKEQLEASDGETPYTWTVSTGHLPPGLTLSAAGVLSGKPTKGEVAAFTVKVTGHGKLSSTEAFGLTVETPPTLTITTPKSGLKVTAPTLSVSGTASDPVGGVAGVYYQLNGGAWSKAESANSFVSWTIPSLPLAADENVLSAYAEDSFGNLSKTNSVKFEYYVTGPLIVKTNGNGSFTPPDNGKDFQIGATFTITAKAAKGFVFEDWANGTSGVTLTHETTLRFVMASNLTLVASFVAALARPLEEESSGADSTSIVDPATVGIIEVAQAQRSLQAMAGSYRAIFAKGQTDSTSRSISVALTGSGAFSGKVLMGADSLPFTGNFDASGVARIPLARKGQNNLTATLRLDRNHQSITCDVAGGAFPGPITATRN